MATIKFYPNKKSGSSKIYFRLIVGRNDIRLSTGLEIVDVKYWSTQTQRPKKNEAKLKKLSKRLDELEDQIFELIEEYSLSEEKSIHDIKSPIIKSLVKEFNNDTPATEKEILHNYASYYADSLKNRTYQKNGVNYPYTEKTIYKYYNFANILKDFSNYKKKNFLIEDVNCSYAADFILFLKETRGSSINTQGKLLRRIKTVVKNAQREGYKIDIDYQNIKSYEDENVVTYLTFDEMEQYQEAVLKNKRQEIARDWFVISFYSGQRISDVQQFNKSMLRKFDGIAYLCFNQQKTNTSVEIPVHYKITEIIKKYNGFPPLLSTNLDSNRSMLCTLIKEGCQIAKINEKVKGRYNGKIGVYPKYKLISNHTGRKSFASNFYGLEGWTLPTIMAITGHKSEKSFLYYIDKTDNTLSRRAGTLMQKMK